MSNVKRGNYYKRKTKDWFERNGYNVEITEFTYQIPGTKFFKKKDILKSDGIAYNENEFILWNSKSATTEENFKKKRSEYTKEYEEIRVPNSIKKVLVVWFPRKDPVFIYVK